jgi:hypothetical protein
VKRALLVLSAAVLSVITFAVPTAARADGGPGGTNCGQTMCKPQAPFVTTLVISAAVSTDGGPGGTNCGPAMCKP